MEDFGQMIAQVVNELDSGKRTMHPRNAHLAKVKESADFWIDVGKTEKDISSVRICMAQATYLWMGAAGDITNQLIGKECELADVQLQLDICRQNLTDVLSKNDKLHEEIASLKATIESDERKNRVEDQIVNAYKETIGYRPEEYPEKFNCFREGFLALLNKLTYT